MPDPISSAELEVVYRRMDREAKLMGTPEGRKQLQEEYLAMCRGRAGSLESGGDAQDLFRRLANAGCPGDAISTATSFGLKETQCLDAAKKFIASPKDVIRVLLLIGSTGLGKTVAAVSVLADFCRKHQWNSGPTQVEPIPPAMFFEAKALGRAFTFGAPDPSLVRRLEYASMLVLDDFGDESNDKARALMTTILMKRIDGGRRTVITGNVRPEIFGERYSEALADRIRTMGISPKLAGKSMRQRRP